MEPTVTELDRGAYDAKRAAPLSGVPLSTVYHWARQGPVRSSVSRSREKLWSYGDLLRLRSIYWLWHVRTVGERVIPASRMDEIRMALEEAAIVGGSLWSVEGGRTRLRLLLDTSGRLYHVAEPVTAVGGQAVLFDRAELDLLGPFDPEGARGPDLVQPRALLRIIPGKCGGEPHHADSRLGTRTVYALKARGFSLDEVIAMYPQDDPVAIGQAVDFEEH